MTILERAREIATEKGTLFGEPRATEAYFVAQALQEKLDEQDERIAALESYAEDRALTEGEDG